MAVKRLTIELDDYPDTDRRTLAPSMLLPKEETLPVSRSKTDIPSRQVDYQEAELGGMPEANVTKEVVGRTPADLVFAFMNRAEFMATVLVFLAFLISVAKLQTLADLWIPLAIAVALNAVWFGGLGIRRFLALKARMGR
jgi:hypothetical protein